jgi:pimeloyl-ACP methyl ester carboxylesterase
MIDDYPISESPPWKLIARELLAITAAGASLPFSKMLHPKATLRREKQRTIVLIHGYLSNSSALFPLAAYLRLRGIGNILVFNYRSQDGIESGARALKTFLRKNVRGGRIDLVCHSLGGLVARVYLQEMGGARRVDRCITLGTPHRGTYNAYWITSKVGRELRPDSKLLKRIADSREKAKVVKFTSFIGGADNIAIPRIFSANDESIHLPDIGHIGMLYSLSLFRSVAERL